jgi:hypothetical protein
MNIIYLLLATLCNILIGITFYRPVHISAIVFMMNVYLTLIQAYRLVELFLVYDLEIWKDPVDNFMLGVTVQTYSIFICLIFLFNSYEFSICKNIIAYSTVIFSELSIVICLCGYEGLVKHYKIIFFGNLISITFFRIIQQVNIESVKNFLSKIEQRNKYEMIV